MDTVNNFITELVGQTGYMAIFLLMALESACIPIPSEITMPVGGWLAADGKLSFFWVGMAGAAGNLGGSLLAYWVGATGGRRLLQRYGKWLFIREHEIARSEEWFARHGEAAVFISRLLPVVRTFISLPAGIARMPLAKFCIYTFAGCLPWSFGLAWGGYLLGDNWEKLRHYMEPASYAIAAIIAIAAIWWFVNRRRVRPQN